VGEHDISKSSVHIPRQREVVEIQGTNPSRKLCKSKLKIIYLIIREMGNVK
jgi:hypothetical protein